MRTCDPTLDKPGLAALFAQQGFTCGAEIGVRRGGFAGLLCQTIPGLRLRCVDPWRAYTTVPRLPSQRTQDANYDRATAYLRPYGVTIDRRLSAAAVQDVPLGSLDFVYIDAHHGFDYVWHDVTQWSARVRSGGIVSGDDYTPVAPGVVQAVDAYTTEQTIDFTTGPRVWYWRQA